jgi:hypothetical protein
MVGTSCITIVVAHCLHVLFKTGGPVCPSSEQCRYFNWYISSGTGGLGYVFYRVFCVDVCVTEIFYNSSAYFLEAMNATHLIKNDNTNNSDSPYGMEHAT